MQQQRGFCWCYAADKDCPASVACLLTSRTGSENLLGAPFALASAENEYCVFAMQMGRVSKPCLV